MSPICNGRKEEVKTLFKVDGHLFLMKVTLIFSDAHDTYLVCTGNTLVCKT